MEPLPRRTWIVLGALALLLTPLPGASQGIWPERGENLQVLPADFSPDRLRAVMQGFTGALGVRCSFCHVGEEGQPLSTFDFVSDANPNKDKARAMYQMLGDINDHLGELEPSGPGRVNMWCHTCHQGKPRPMTLQETLGEVATLAAEMPQGNERQEIRAREVGERFLALREAFYGGNQYDFRAPNVNGIASGFLQTGDTATAAVLYQANVEHYPDWGPGHESLGNLAALRGEVEAARSHYRRALELAGDDARLRLRVEAALERLGGGG